MPLRIMAEIFEQYCTAQDNLLGLVEGLTDEQIRWTPNLTTPCIGFHVWHLARWADYLQEIINGRGTQIWETQNLAAHWNLETASLGYAQTGMGMDDATAAALPIPAKPVVLDYARCAFDAAQRAVERIGDDGFYTAYEVFHKENWRDGQIGPIIATWLTHDNRHLGMIECLVGVQGTRGSADI